MPNKLLIKFGLEITEIGLGPSENKPKSNTCPIILQVITLVVQWFINTQEESPLTSVGHKAQA